MAAIEKKPAPMANPSDYTNFTVSTKHMKNYFIDKKHQKANLAADLKFNEMIEAFEDKKRAEAAIRLANAAT